MELRVARQVDVRALNRVRSMSDSAIRNYLNDSSMSLGVALDMWNHHNAPSDEVTMALDALIALWTEAERRGLAVNN